jgi:hypothetical protein
MLRKTMQWVLITALLLAVTWRPAENHQMPLDFVICTGAVMVLLALFFTKHEIATGAAKSCTRRISSTPRGGLERH